MWSRCSKERFFVPLQNYPSSSVAGGLLKAEYECRMVLQIRPPNSESTRYQLSYIYTIETPENRICCGGVNRLFWAPWIARERGAQQYSSDACGFATHPLAWRPRTVGDGRVYIFGHKTGGVSAKTSLSFTVPLGTRDRPGSCVAHLMY